MAPLAITALTCGYCHKSGIASWRADIDAPCEVIFLSDPFRAETGTSSTEPTFICAGCRQPARLRPLHKEDDVDAAQVASHQSGGPCDDNESA